MNVVLDASAMIAYLRDEPGAESVSNHIQHSQRHVFAHALNLCEVFYDFARANGEDTAQGAINDLLTLGIGERSDMGPQFWQAMGRLKANQACLLGGLRCLGACTPTFRRAAHC